MAMRYWVVTERTRLRIQTVKIIFLRWVAGLSFRDMVRKSVISRAVAPLR